MKNKLLSLATIVSLSCIPHSAQSQAPNLGSTAGFVLFTSIGAVGNTGISKLTGHVGTNNGAITGFGNVNGVMNNSNGASALCAADLIIAYNQLNATIATLFPAPLLGNGQSLNAGIYSISGNSTLSNTLILNGQNNSNAIFIIKIQGSFAAAANAQVILTNGAMACNVYWKIEGQVSMAAGSSMKGTIIANNAAIILNSGAKLEGRALSTSGGITIDGTFAYTPVGCNSPYLTGPSSPTLNTTACYALFSSNGPVTNSGVSFIYGGDIGTNVGLTTGFNALNVTGAIHPIPDGSTGACSTDLLTLYNYLNTLPYDIELLYPAQFGRGLVLTPHVYRMNSAATFVDTLFLDGMGNANAVFVIQANGAVATATYAQVKLINGTQAKNVFWKIEGALNVGGYSEMVGTIVVNNAAINFSSNSTLLGRALSTNGALSTAAVNVTVTPGCGVANTNITTQPSNQTICSGLSTSLMVAASGSSLTYVWRKGTLLLNNSGNISGANTATLTINPVTSADAGNNYNVVITSSSAPSVISNSVSVTVQSSPSITSQPINQVSCESSAVNFSVAANGTGLTYAWRLGSVNLTNGGSISGVNTATLTINPVTAVDAALNYNVVISGVCNPQSISNDAALNICVTTDINEYQKNGAIKQIALYPNPFNQSINLTIKEFTTESNFEISIFNLLGAEVITTKITKEQFNLNTSELPSGIYYYQIKDAKKIIQDGKLISIN